MCERDGSAREPRQVTTLGTANATEQKMETIHGVHVNGKPDQPREVRNSGKIGLKRVMNKKAISERGEVVEQINFAER